ncbi:hypothetical protein U1Q18_030039 [Sarracenia purpurea var. burkii]
MAGFLQPRSTAPMASPFLSLASPVVKFHWTFFFVLKPVTHSISLLPRQMKPHRACSGDVDGKRHRCCLTSRSPPVTTPVNDAFFGGFFVVCRGTLCLRSSLIWKSVAGG